MGKTSIEWTAGDDGAIGRTWNPVRGCSRVSEGCRNCYAEKIAARFAGPGMPYEGLATIGKRGARWTGEVRLIPDQLEEPLRWRKPQRVFVNSMSDLFHEKLANEDIAAVFGVMAACPQHTFQVLTKRPEQMRGWFEWLADLRTPDGAFPMSVDILRGHLSRLVTGDGPWSSFSRWTAATALDWPLPNVWLGVSVEDQKTADERIPLLLETRAAVRFVSYEPALGPVDFRRFLAVCSRCGEVYGRRDHGRCDDECAPGAGHFACGGEVTGLDWVIVGGESGPGARPFDLAWARSVVEQCRAAGVPAFVKQLGARPVLDGEPARYSELPPFAGPGGPVTYRRITNRKGNDQSEWPEDLRVRQWPRVTPHV